MLRKSLLALVLVAQGVTAQVWPDHLVWSERLVDDVRANGLRGNWTNADSGIELNRYGGSFGETYVRVRGWGGETVSENYSRCASYLTLLFNKVYGWSSTPSTGSASPYAYQYNHLIKNAVGAQGEPFAKVVDFRTVLPGDVLAVDYVVPPVSGEATGHIFQVRRVDWDNATFDADTQQTTYPVHVLDCSSSRHDDDTRVFPGVTTQGVGRGWIAITTDSDGNIVSHRWRISSGDTYTQAERHVAIGRFAGQAFSFLPLAGTVGFDANVGAGEAEVTVRVTQGGSTWTLPGFTDAEGNLRVWGPLAPGLYDVAAKGPNSLRHSVPNVLVGAEGATGLAFALVLGDVNGDNSVNIADFLRLRAAFGSSAGQLAYDFEADLNRDGSVGIPDFLILRSNFGRSGAA